MQGDCRGAASGSEQARLRAPPNHRRNFWHSGSGLARCRSQRPYGDGGRRDNGERAGKEGQWGASREGGTMVSERAGGATGSGRGGGPRVGERGRRDNGERAGKEGQWGASGQEGTTVMGEGGPMVSERGGGDNGEGGGEEGQGGASREGGRGGRERG